MKLLKLVNQAGNATMITGDGNGSGPQELTEALAGLALFSCPLDEYICF